MRDPESFAVRRRLSVTLDGRPVRLDPGKHRFRFVLPWGDVLTSDAWIREGEKNRVVTVQVKRKLPDKPEPPPAAAPPDSLSLPLPSPEPAPKRAMPLGFWIASGVGAAALGSWGAFALAGRGEQTTLETCSPTCDASLRDNYDAMRRNYLIADVSLGVAAVSFGVAAWYFFSEQRSNTQAVPQGSLKRPLSLAVSPLVTTSGASVVLSGNSF